jgi:hypothetical protein
VKGCAVSIKMDYKNHSVMAVLEKSMLEKEPILSAGTTSNRLDGRMVIETKLWPKENKG